MTSTRDDWLHEGLELLKAGRFDALTIDGLCKRLKRTKGAFYHHFDGVQAFKEALLARWEESHTRSPMRLSSEGTEEQRRQALRKATATLDARLERAVRAWASVDSLARDACGRVDEQRIGYLADLYADEPKAAARKRARLEYAQLLGLMILYDRAT